jgi:hypothetical protein
MCTFAEYMLWKVLKKILTFLIIFSCILFTFSECSGLTTSNSSFEQRLMKSVKTSNGEAYVRRLVQMNHSAAVKTDGGNWTFMVYLDGDNNLEVDCIDIFLDLSSVGSTADVNIVVQLDRISGHDDRFGDWTDCKRFHVTEGMTPTPGNATLDLGEVNMGDLYTLANFVNWTISSYPADKYCLVLSDHGSGCASVQSVCFDETSSNDALSLPELSQALSVAPAKMDVIYFDACVMGMVEVAYQIRDYADVMVASEEVGWSGAPYDYYLSSLTANPSMSTGELADVIVSGYIDFTSANSLMSTMSGVDLSQMLALETAVDSFAQTLNNSESSFNDEIRKARGQAEGYMGPFLDLYGWYMDLYHFAELVYQYIDDFDIRNNASQVMASVSNAVIVEGHYDHPNSHGLSIFFPCKTDSHYSTFMTAYSTTDFAEDTVWDAFIDYHVSITPQKPDFVVVDVYWSPSSPNPGDAVTFYADMTNEGTQDKSAYVRFSRDGSSTGSTFDFPVCSPVTIFTISPWTASPGKYNITWIIDPNNNTEEWNETNNQMTKWLIVGCSLTIQTPYSGITVKIDGYSYATKPDGSYQKYVSSGFHSVEVPASPSLASGTRGLFVQWNDGNSSNVRNIFVDSDLTMTAEYVTQYYLTVKKNPSYIGETTGQDWYNNGTIANATCTSPVPYYSYRYVFVNWTGDAFGTSTTLQILMNSSKTVTANYKAQYNVTFTTYGCGGSPNVTVDDVSYALPCSFWLDSGSSHAFSYESPVSGDTGVRYVLTSTSYTSPLTVTYGATVTGYYKTQFYIPVNSAHGTPTPSQWLDRYSSLPVNVQSPTETTPNQTRWLCTGYSVDHSPPQVGTSYTFYSIQGPHEIEFYWIQQFWLQINTNPTDMPQPIVSLEGPWYDNGTLVTCTAQRTSGYGFDYWMVDETSWGSGVNPIMVTMNTSHEVTAYYFTDDVEPSIGVPVHQPNPPNQGENVTVTVIVNDGGSGVSEVFLYYRTDGDEAWTEVNMSKLTEDTYVCEIPGFETEMHVQYYITAYDNAYNQAIQDKNGEYYDYIVIPEFQEFVILLLFISLSLIAVVLSKKIRHKQQRTLNYEIGR